MVVFLLAVGFALSDNRGMTASRPIPKMRRLGPYSKNLTRGAVGDVDGRSREGRFLRDAETQLLEQIGGDPSFSQQLLIRRIVKMMLLAEKLDEKLTGGGEWTPHDARTFGGLNGALRVALKDLGLKTATKAKTPSLADYAAERAAQRKGAVT
jgi:hypothetical protein